MWIPVAIQFVDPGVCRQILPNPRYKFAIRKGLGFSHAQNLVFASVEDKGKSPELYRYLVAVLPLIRNLREKRILLFTRCGVWKVLELHVEQFCESNEGGSYPGLQPPSPR